MKPERGAILIMVALSLLVLTLFSAFVVDQGMLYTARRQAQNTADAAALAGALARTWDDTSDPPASKTSGVIWDSAYNTATKNAIWGETPQPASITLDWTCPAGPAAGTTQCVVADVLPRELPTVFLHLVGIDTQHTRAHAVAWPAGSNIADCLRPWFILDKPGAGYTTDDIGSQVILDSRVITSGFGKIDVGSGEDAVVDTVHGCAPGGNYHLGQTVATQTGGAGNPTIKAVQDVIDWDLGAHYDPYTKTIEGSCAPSCNCDPYICPNVGRGMSPRIFIAPICSPTGDPGCVSGGNGVTHEITITKFLTYFIESAEWFGGSDIKIVATLVGGAGEYSADYPDSPAPFLRTIMLIR